MNLKPGILLFAFIITFLNSNAQVDEHEMELRDHFWNDKDTLFHQTETPERWKNESAVILAKRIEYSVHKKSFSNKLLENHYVHERIKIQDLNALERYSNFSFKEKQRQYRGMFSYETIKYYLGIKVIKKDGTVQEVSLDDAVKQELASGSKEYSIQKIAIPNLELGDIIDYYKCVERKFPQSGFYEFSPIFYELEHEYPVVCQQLSVEVLRMCYLNAKSINGAPKFELQSNDGDEVNVFVMTDSFREKAGDDKWVRQSVDSPILKFQAYYNSSHEFTKGYNRFYGISGEKISDKIKPDALVDLSHTLRQSVANGNHYYFGVYQATLKYLKAQNKIREHSTDELLREGYYFLREYWYQQYFFLNPQNQMVFYTHLDEVLTVSILSAVLHKLKRDYEVVYSIPNFLTRKDDLLFLGELMPGIKSIDNDSLVILSAGPFKPAYEVPIEYTNTKAYAVVCTRNNDYLDSLEIRDDKIELNQTNVHSTFEMDTNSDSIHVHSKFNFVGVEKFEWDTVTHVGQVIRDEYNFEKYQNYIKDRPLRNYNSPHILKRKEKLINRRQEESAERLEGIKNKLIEYYGFNDVRIKSFELIQSGRWDDAASLKFEVKFVVGGLIKEVGSKKLLSIGKFFPKSQGELKKERQYDIYLPYKKSNTHQVTIINAQDVNIEGLENFDYQYQTPNLELNTSSTKANNEISLHWVELVKNAHIKKEDWGELLNLNKSKKKITSCQFRYE